MKTYIATPSTIQRKWYLVDATDKTLGRLAAEVAKVLRGKNKPTFTPNMDTGDYVIVINADKVRLTGKKLVQKTYFHYTGYMGGDRFVKAADMLKDKPTRMVELAVKGMVPHTRLGRQQMTKLKVYAGASHPHEAQQPTAITL